MKIDHTWIWWWDDFPLQIKHLVLLAQKEDFLLTRLKLFFIIIIIIIIKLDWNAKLWIKGVP